MGSLLNSLAFEIENKIKDMLPWQQQITDS